MGYPMKWDPRLVDLIHRRPELLGIGVSNYATEVAA